MITPYIYRKILGGDVDFSWVIKWVKLSPMYLLGLFTLAGVYLFAPESITKALGIIQIRENYRPLIGFVFLASSAMLMGIWIYCGYNVLIEKWQRHQKLARLKKYLHRLTTFEKLILRSYIYPKTRKQKLKEYDGNVIQLVHNQIIHKVSNVALKGGVYTYNIQNWAWDYLIENKRLLDINEETESA
jgi:Super-infection exclusion protein B